MISNRNLVIAFIFGSWCFSVSAQEEEEIDSDRSTQHPDIEELSVIGIRKANYTEITENTQKLVEMPGALGDPLAAITALPGVLIPRSGGEPAVRGSSPSDNRYYIDGMPAGYIFHEFNTSIFDENVVQNFQLFSAGFGAQYSGSTGAIFDIRLRDPENKSIDTTLNISLLRAGVFTEGAVTSNSEFYLSLRKGLIQFFLPEDSEANEDGIRIISAPEDDDYQFKYKWDINAQSKLTLSLAGASDFTEVGVNDISFFAQENPDFAGDAKVDNRFDSQSLNWEYDADNSSNFLLTLAHFNNHLKTQWGDNFSDQGDTDSSLIRTQYRFPLTTSHTITSGVEYYNRSHDYGFDVILFVCTEFDVDCQDGRRERVQNNGNINFTETSLYIIDSWQVTSTLNLETGIQRSANDYTDESFINPRLAVTWDVHERYTLVAATGLYNRMQDLENILPQRGNPDLKSQTAKHYILGVKSTIDDYWNWSAELYHKTMSRLPLSLTQEEQDSELIYSNDVDGEANGVDFIVNREVSDRWYGWLAVSYSQSERTNLRDGKTIDYTLDTPLVLNVVGNYQLAESWVVSFRFTTKSGEADTEIIGVKPNPEAPDYYLPVYGEPYADRLPTYARLDIKIKRDFDFFDNDASVYIDILNALNRDNITERRLDYEKVNATGEVHTESIADLGIFPSLGVSLTF